MPSCHQLGCLRSVLPCAEALRSPNCQERRAFFFWGGGKGQGSAGKAAGNCHRQERTLIW